MNKNHIIVAIVLLIIGTILIAGCSFPADSENHTNNVSVNVTTFTDAATSLQTQCPSSGNATPWIIINPIGSHYIGDVFEINGTTNIGINETLLIDIAGPGPIGTRIPPQQHEIRGIVRIQKRDCNINDWLFLINTSDLGAGFYPIVVSSENLTVSTLEGLHITGKFQQKGASEK